MAEKIFIGRVFEDRWNNPELTLTGEDLKKLTQHLNKEGKVKIAVKKSQTKGTYYAEINTFEPRPKEGYIPGNGNGLGRDVEDIEALPF